MEKSYFNPDPRRKYCINHSLKLHPIQEKLIHASLEHEMGKMLGDMDVIQMCTILIKRISAKKVLDVGTFTGFSALSWALALPEDGTVITMDVSDKDYLKYGKQFVDEAGVSHKIDVRVQPALQTLDDLISSGQSGQFQFAFLDAAKSEYPQYYEKCMQLLEAGGIIAVDNAIWKGLVMEETRDKGTEGIHQLNEIIANDPRVDNILLPIGDGLNLAFKK